MAESSPDTRPWFRSRSGMVLLAFLAIAAFFVVTEHTAHALGALPYLLLLACPLLHWLHGGHGRGHGDHGGDDDPPRARGER
jgi:hypothetical protein